MRGHVLELTFAADGCRIVQQAIQVAGKDELVDLVAELRGHVCAAIKSPHGNYVIQKIVETLPAGMSSVVVEELLGVASSMAWHRYGCRVLCRLFEHCSSEVGVIALANELTNDSLRLCRDMFGHHVMQSMLEHGQPEHKRQVAETLVARAVDNVKDRNASYVIESALTHCDAIGQQMLAASIMNGGARQIEVLACTQVGKRVLKALLNVRGFSEVVLQNLQQSALYLSTNKQGRRLLHDLDMLPWARQQHKY